MRRLRVEAFLHFVERHKGHVGCHDQPCRHIQQVKGGHDACSVRASTPQQHWQRKAHSVRLATAGGRLRRCSQQEAGTPASGARRGGLESGGACSLPRSACRERRGVTHVRNLPAHTACRRQHRPPGTFDPQHVPHLGRVLACLLCCPFSLLTPLRAAMPRKHRHQGRSKTVAAGTGGAFHGFGAYTGGAAAAPLELPHPVFSARPVIPYAGQHPAVLIACKLALKRDLTSQAKGLTELAALVAKAPSEVMPGLLAPWSYMFPTACLSNDRHVRRAAQEAMSAVVRGLPAISAPRQLTCRTPAPLPLATGTRVTEGPRTLPTSAAPSLAAVPA